MYLATVAMQYNWYWQVIVGQRSLDNITRRQYMCNVYVWMNEQLHFASLELNSQSTSCELQCVELFNGRLTSSPSIGKFCQQTTAPGDIRSQSNVVRILLHTDASSTGRGFRIDYDLEPQGLLRLLVMFTVCVREAKTALPCVFHVIQRNISNCIHQTSYLSVRYFYMCIQWATEF